MTAPSRPRREVDRPPRPRRLRRTGRGSWTSEAILQALGAWADEFGRHPARMTGHHRWRARAASLSRESRSGSASTPAGPTTPSCATASAHGARHSTQPGSPQVGVGLPRASRQRDHLRARDHGSQRAHVHNGRRQHHVRREPRRQSRQLVGIRRPQPQQLRPEAHRVLDGVKALEHDQTGVAPCAPQITEFDH
jgi:hypothetical protein